jgi:amino-acid N-acetyltransferase
MNTELVTLQPSPPARRRSRPGRRVRPQRVADSVVLCAGTATDAPAIHALIEAHLAEGHLLPRSLGELEIHAPRFVVAVDRKAPRAGRDEIVACAELAPLSAHVAEVRSLVVHQSVRARGIGRRLVDELRRSASRAGFDRLCAFTHDAGYFVRKGFSIVPHEWVPEKIARDCSGCPLFRSCGQYAVMLPL